MSPCYVSVLRESTSFHIGWSYVLAWVGIGSAFLSCVSYTAATFSIRNDIKVKKLQVCGVPRVKEISIYYNSVSQPFGLQVPARDTFSSYCQRNFFQYCPSNIIFSIQEHQRDTVFFLDISSNTFSIH